MSPCRLAYDTHGDAGAHRSFAAAAAARQQHAAPGFGGGPGDFTFDDLERWFRAQAAMRHAHAQQRSRGAGAAPPGSGDAELSALRAVLAALVAAVLLFSAATAPAEPAALRRGAATPAGPAATAARGVPFYHAPDFDAAFPVASRRRAEAEHRLENSYGNLLVRECEAQRAAQGSAELWAALRGRPPPPEPPACGELRAKFADWFASAGGVRY